MILMQSASAAAAPPTGRWSGTGHDREMQILDFYRASELHGGLVLTRLAQRCRDGELAADLLKHGAEEIEHARLWTETMLALGGRPRPTRDTYQRRYAAVVGPPNSVLRVLALTHVFERRVYGHFQEHARQPATHPLVRATLRRMIEEERGHLSWVRRWLDAESIRRGAVVDRILRSYERADAAIYESLIHEYGFSTVLNNGDPDIAGSAALPGGALTDQPTGGPTAPDSTTHRPRPD
jgi:bacterioferritin (cytochrome b1)